MIDQLLLGAIDIVCALSPHYCDSAHRQDISVKVDPTAKIAQWNPKEVALTIKVSPNIKDNRAKALVIIHELFETERVYVPDCGTAEGDSIRESAKYLQLMLKDPKYTYPLNSSFDEKIWFTVDLTIMSPSFADTIVPCKNG